MPSIDRDACGFTPLAEVIIGRLEGKFREAVVKEAKQVISGDCVKLGVNVPSVVVNHAADVNDRTYDARVLIYVENGAFWCPRFCRWMV
jgi:hypothetical protein